MTIVINNYINYINEKLKNKKMLYLKYMIVYIFLIIGRAEATSSLTVSMLGD